MGLTKLQSRTLLRNMVKMRIIATYMNDMGRQRITKYVSKKFEKSSKMSKQFNKEMHKIRELTKGIVNENEKNVNNEASSQSENDRKKHEDDEAIQKFHSDNHASQIAVDASVINENKDRFKDKDVEANHVRGSASLHRTFYTINRILHKYRLSKFLSKYACTSRSFLSNTICKVDTKEEGVKSDVSSISMQQIANDAEATLFYNSIKTNLVMQKPICKGNGDGEDFSFMEVLQNSEKKNISNITYRYVQVHINNNNYNAIKLTTSNHIYFNYM